MMISSEGYNHNWMMKGIRVALNACWLVLCLLNSLTKV